jgi:hypothetical protein
MGNDVKIDPDAHRHVATTAAPEEPLRESISVPGYGDRISMKAGTDILNLTMSNPQKNTVYFQYSIILIETGEVLYKSDRITPGLEITEQKLSRKFEKGEYPITVKIDTIDVETHATTNGANIKSNLVVS